MSHLRLPSIMLISVIKHFLKDSSEQSWEKWPGILAVPARGRRPPAEEWCAPPWRGRWSCPEGLVAAGTGPYWKMADPRKHTERVTWPLLLTTHLLHPFPNPPDMPSASLAYLNGMRISNVHWNRWHLLHWWHHLQSTQDQLSDACSDVTHIMQAVPGGRRQVSGQLDDALFQDRTNQKRTAPQELAIDALTVWVGGEPNRPAGGKRLTCRNVK